MDVTFIESENSFTSQSSHSSLKGEMTNEEQNWEDWPGYDDVEVDALPREPMTIVIDQRKGNVDYVKTETEQQTTRVYQSGEAT